MTMAEAAGIDPTNAVQTGTMAITLPGVGLITSYEDFRKKYNEGEFTKDANGNNVVPAASKLLRPYSPPRKEEGGKRKKVKGEDGVDEELEDDGGTAT